LLAGELRVETAGRAGIEVMGRWITVKILGVHGRSPGDDDSAYVPLSAPPPLLMKRKEMHAWTMDAHARRIAVAADWLADWTQNDPSCMHASLLLKTIQCFVSRQLFGGECACMHAYGSTSSQWYQATR
jgi:hypothetical protein